MGTIVIFPQDRVVRTITRSSRVEELEIRILDLLRILRHRKSDKTVAEILKLREEIGWRLKKRRHLPERPRRAVIRELMPAPLVWRAWRCPTIQPLPPPSALTRPGRLYLPPRKSCSRTSITPNTRRSSNRSIRRSIVNPPNNHGTGAQEVAFDNAILETDYGCQQTHRRQRPQGRRQKALAAQDIGDGRRDLD